MARYSTQLKPKPKQKNNMLPLWLALAGLVLVFIAAFALFGNDAQTNATVIVKGEPRLTVEKDKIDHGEVKLGSYVLDTVRVTNVGDQPMKFIAAPYLEVKEGC